MTPSTSARLRPALHSPWRWPVAALLVVAGAAHIPVTPEHLREAPYMGVAFATFVVVAFVTALLLAARDSRALYLFVVALGTAAVLTYAATRMVAFPQLGDDVGNWGETLGVLSIVTESAAVVLSAAALRLRTAARPVTA